MRSHKKIAAGVLALALAANSVCIAAYAVGAFDTVVPGLARAAADEKVQLGTFRYADSTTLGSVNSYAVFSYTYHQYNHMEGVFATEAYDYTGRGYGTSDKVIDYIDPDHTGEHYIYIGGFVGDALKNIQDGLNNPGNGVDRWDMIVPDYIDFIYDEDPDKDGIILADNTDPDYHVESQHFNHMSDLCRGLYHISDTTYTIDFNKAFTSLKSFSTTASEANTQGNGTNVVYDEANRLINVECSQGNNVINLDSAYLETANDQDGYNINITGKDGETDYTLIINITGLEEKGSVTYNSIITIDGVHANGYVPEAGKLLFNFCDTTGTNVTFGKADVGVILAPWNNVKIMANSHNGSVFANDVTNDRCQIHQNPFRGGIAGSKIDDPSSEEDTSSEENSSSEESSSEVGNSSVTDSSSNAGIGGEDTDNSSSEEDPATVDSSSEEDPATEDSSSNTGVGGNNVDNSSSNGGTGGNAINDSSSTANSSSTAPTASTASTASNTSAPAATQAVTKSLNPETGVGVAFGAFALAAASLIVVSRKNKKD